MEHIHIVKEVRGKRLEIFVQPTVVDDTYECIVTKDARVIVNLSYTLTGPIELPLPDYLRVWYMANILNKLCLSSTNPDLSPVSPILLTAIGIGKPALLGKLSSLSLEIEDHQKNAKVPDFARAEVQAKEHLRILNEQGIVAAGLFLHNIASARGDEIAYAQQFFDIDDLRPNKQKNVDPDEDENCVECDDTDCPANPKNEKYGSTGGMAKRLGITLPLKFEPGDLKKLFDGDVHVAGEDDDDKQN